MSRARAEALALVNWKGVFYERYLLDRHVTALEGANGAGKTTVMIAAYVVLLPDMTRLRFTNLGETGATGGDKGIWGRLGEAGRPSYAVFDFALPDKRRILAGVHIERKGEPSVEMMPFIVSGLADDVRLQDLLLVSQGDNDAVPELPELRENAARLGGRLQSFLTAREYFSALFDEGVTPLRLATEEERSKLNEMLRTSMTGGISRALTSELRAFLLKEEGGLADTLQRMRANLDACRRTRTEVQESRRLEREIGGVFGAGQMMFAAALLATRERVEEMTRRVEDAEAACAAAVETHRMAQDALDRTLSAVELLERRRGEIGQVLEAAQAWHTRLRDALAAAQQLLSCLEQLALAQRVTGEAERHRSVAETERTRTGDDLSRAQEDYRLAVEGLADLQQGIQELHRRAGAYQQSIRRLREAGDNLGEPSIAASAIVERSHFARAELATVDAERRDLITRHADAEAHREQHTEVLRQLCALIEHDVALDRAYDAALSALQEYRAHVSLAGRLATLEGELAEAQRLAIRQSNVRERAQALGVILGDESAGDLVMRLHGDAERELLEHEERERIAKAFSQQAEATMRELQSRRRALIEREPTFRDLAARAARIAAHLATPVDSPATLHAARATLDSELVRVRKAEDSARDEHEALLRQARDLLAQGGPFAPELLRLRDQLGAELVAGSFEDVELAEAARLEATLGPLASALVVDDPRTVAGTLGSRPDTLADVWLVSRDSELEQLTSATNMVHVEERDVAVEAGCALRVSRVPSRPRLGRRAREARAADLHREAEDKSYELEGLRTRRRELERLVADGDALLAAHLVWLAGDPAFELAEAKRALVEAEAELGRQRAASARHAEAARTLRPRVNGLRALLGEAMFLDPPDHRERATTLAQQCLAARQAKDLVGRQKSRADFVDRNQAVLRDLPLSADELIRLGDRVHILKAQRERLQSAIDALDYVQTNVEALGWEDAPRRLSRKLDLVLALKDQLRDAKAHQATAEESAKVAEKRFNVAVAAFQDADGERRAAVKAHAAAVASFERFGVPEPSPVALAAAAEDVDRLDEEHRSHDGTLRGLLTAKGRHEGEVAESARALRTAEDKVLRERAEAEPAVQRWDDLRELAQRNGLIGSILVEAPAELADIHGHVNLVQKANEGRALLLDRLARAQGAATLLAELDMLRAPSEGEFAAAALDLWLTVRDWLRHRLPAHVAEVDDPREALLRLRDRLSTVEERLARQESDLRGASEDIARGIEIQIRKARGQVNRLTKNLEGVAFGNIQGIRVRLQSVERMEQVLRALREGSAQKLLFEADMPIEDALDEIFRRFGGGKTGGHRLLDYREYVHLQVEIRRKTEKEWEIANPTRVSTGEAIGVGAALMMVVLTEWERDATVLRAKKSHGSLRFLFLDEANRLSPDNVGVLFDLCQTLDLQLLIAAPEVARAGGNTTYRLVRRATPDGREEVVVSGRRTKRDA